MRPLLDDAFGNPSSGHWASTPTKAALERARGQVATLLGSAPDEIVFTSGGSEANNLVIKGKFFALRHKGEHIIATAVEHPAFLAPCRFSRAAWRDADLSARRLNGSDRSRSHAPRHRGRACKS